MAYKHAIPVCGAIILNETLTKVTVMFKMLAYSQNIQCLLVKGWYSRSSWGFPKGKIGKDEDPSDCAVREVFEETGFDISSRLSSNNFIDAHSTTGNNSTTSQQSTRLFIIPGVPESTVFNPQTRKEISKIQWHPIEDLPTKFGQDNSFYNVVNFVKKLKQWIKTRGQEYKSIGKKKKSNKTTQSQSYKFKNNSNDIFDKLRLKNDNSPVNSVLMRDNPSPIHLFEKLSPITNNIVNPSKKDKDKLLMAIEVFADSLKTLKINRSVIRESINKSFQ